ncbi:hypothetical protein D3C80_1943990 [compost metagenome]
MARIVAASGMFHLDDLGAQVGKILRAPRPRQNSGKVEYLDAGEGLIEHAVSTLCKQSAV